LSAILFQGGWNDLNVWHLQKAIVIHPTMKLKLSLYHRKMFLVALLM